MANARCPFCGCKTFYLKDPDDEYETYEFEFVDGEAVWNSKDDARQPECTEDSEAFCNNCSWHGKVREFN